jgi:hypothetical protein
MSDLNAVKKSELLNCELSEQELDKVAGCGKNTKGASQQVSESLSLNFSKVEFKYTA